MSERLRDQATESSGIVLTDEPARPAKKGPCPNCSAPPSARTASNGFGRTFNEICGQCGYKFAEKRRA